MKRKFIALSFALVLTLCALFVLSCGVELTDPQNVRYDGKTITWDSVEDATKYFISINGGQEWPVSSNTYNYNPKGQEFSVSVTAANDEGKDVVKSGTYWNT